MEIKFNKKVKLSHQQLNELPEILQEPYNGWQAEYEELHDDTMKSGVYDVTAQGMHGKYTYRVNLSFELITVLEVTS
jgi:uncharacterized protein with FMN-binding domain